MALRYAIAVLCASCCAVPALAQISVEASLDQLGYTVSDLDPADGIAPALTLGAPVYTPRPGDTARGWLDYSTRVPPAATTTRSGYVYQSAGGLSGSHSYEYGSGWARMTGRDNWTTQALSMGVEIEPVEDTVMTSRAEIWSDTLVFTLAPRTRATFTATVSGWAEASPDPDFIGMAQIFGAVRLMNILNPNNLQFGDAAILSGGTEDGAIDIDGSELLTVSYDNLTDEPAYVRAQVELDVLARVSAVSAVPEPAPVAMLLAGGLLLRLRSRRRRG